MPRVQDLSYYPSTDGSSSIYRLTFLATMILALLHVIRTRTGAADRVVMTNHSTWVGGSNKNDASA